MLSINNNIDKELLEITFEGCQSIKNNKLFSVVILSYQNIGTLYASIKSVLNQTYTRIELIIGDDGSDFFPISCIHEYVENNRNENLERLVIRKFNKNQGITINAKDSIERIKGDYYFTIGADDILNDCKVIEDYEQFMSNNPETWWAMGMVTVVSADYKRTLFVYPSKDDCDIIKNGNKTEILGFFSYKGAPAPCFCFKKGVVELVDGIDLEYKMLEDWPLFIKLLKKDYLPSFFWRYIVKQGSSGITKDKTKNSINKRLIYARDKELLFLKEIIPLYPQLSKRDRRKSKRYYNSVIKQQIYYDCEYVVSSRTHKTALIIKHPCILKWILNEKANKIRSIVHMSRTSYSSLLLSSLLSILISILVYNMPLDFVLKIIVIAPLSLLSLILSTTLALCLYAGLLNLRKR